MSRSAIFETSRLLVRKLQMRDLEAFHEMQSNPKVMQFADGEVKSFEEHKKEIRDLIGFYEKESNDFWIYAIERKSDQAFVGTVALVKDIAKDNEIGFRFLEKYWGKGYGSEIGFGLIAYCKSISMPKLVGYVIDQNVASAQILQKLGFEIVAREIEPKTGLPETKYQLTL